MNGNVISAAPESVFATVDAETGKQRIFHITQANRLLVRKCLVPKSNFLFSAETEVTPGTPDNSRAGEFLVQSFMERTDTNWCEVLAVGPKRPYSDSERAMYGSKDSHGRPIKLPKGWRIIFDVKPGDFVAVPEMTVNPCFGQVTGFPYDFFVHEGDCLLGITAEEHAAMLAKQREATNARN
jgi:hypothetical protein